MRLTRLCAIGSLCFLLSGCITFIGGGYMFSTKNSTVTFASYGNTEFTPEAEKAFRAYMGEYQVKRAWNNLVERAERLSIQFENNKAVLLVYPKDWEKPSYKIEFSSCKIIKEESKFLPLHHVEDYLYCENNYKENARMQIGRTNVNSTGKAYNPELITSLLVDSREVSVKDFPYALSYKNWSDNPAPLFGVEKIK